MPSSAVVDRPRRARLRAARDGDCSGPRPRPAV